MNYMKPIKLTAVFASLLFFVACQKELSIETGGTPGGGGTGGGTGGGNSSGATLVKRVNQLGSTDSVVENFTYDSNKKLVKYTLAGSLLTLDEDKRGHYIRNSQGKITRIVDSAYDFLLSRWDSTITDVFYNGSSISHLIRLTNNTDKDSVAITYTNGKITSAKFFQFSGGSYSPDIENTYAYDGNGNITNVKYYDISGTTPVLENETKYSYDNKTSPLQLGEEAVITGLDMQAGPNNFNKVEDIDMSTSTPTSSTSTFTITYRTDNTPASATIVIQLSLSPVPLNATSTYYYQ